MMDVKERFNVTIKGSGKQTLLFVHGLGCDQSIWRKIAPVFEKDYSVILIDLIGFGLSKTQPSDQEKHTSLHGYAADLLEIIDAFHLENLIIVTHSVSTMIGLLAYIEKPSKFSRMVMIGPSPYYLNDREYKGGWDKREIDQMLEMMNTDLQKWSSVITPQIVGNASQPALTAELNDSFCRANPTFLKSLATLTFTSDNRKDLSHLNIPTLILQCAEDIIAPDFVGEFVHQQVKTSELVHLKAKGHCPHLSDPEETVEEIQIFLGKKF